NGWAQSRLEGNLAFWWVWGFDRSVLWAAGGVVTLAIVVLGGVVATRAARTGINAVLQDGGRGCGGRREGRMARGRVVTQVALVSLLVYCVAILAVLGRLVVYQDFRNASRSLLLVSVEQLAERFPVAARIRALCRGLNANIPFLPELLRAGIRLRLAEIDDEG